MSFVNKGSMVAKVVVSASPDRSGNFVCNGVSDETEINLAINSLTAGRTWQEKVLLKGNFDIDGPIVVPAWTYLTVDGKISKAAGAACAMLQNANPASNDVAVLIEGGHWEGNRGLGATGECIDWEHSTNPADTEFCTVTFRDMYITDSDETSLHIDANGSSESIWYFKNLHFRHGGHNANDYVMHFDHVYDVFMDTVHVSAYSAVVASLFEGGGPFKFTNIEWAHQTQFDQSGGIYMANCLSENGADLDAFLLKAVSHSMFANVYCRIGGDNAYVGNAAFKLEDSNSFHCHDLSFLHCGGGRRGGTDSNRYNFIFEEAADQYDNRYLDVICDDYVTAVADMQGTGQKLNFITMAFKPYNGSTDAQYGVDVDAATEEAVAAGFLPPSVHEVVFIVLDAHAIALAGQEMEIELHVDGGAGNEAWNTHTTTQANLDAQETNTAADDILTWMINSRDYANVRALTAGDRVRVSATYEVGDAGDTSTDAHFGSATLYYV